jgi:prepilin-type processing-associated H-X9-DG protein
LVLPWAATSLLSYDVHDRSNLINADGTTPGRYIIDPNSIGVAQPPNNQGPNTDMLYDCPDPAGAQFDQMPCQTYLGRAASWLSAAPRSRHVGGVNVTFVDGHGGFIPNQIDDRVMAHLVSINDGQVVPGF